MPLVTERKCKVQVVDKFRPRESKDQAVHFQTIIVQDESKEQVCIILYGDDIARYHNLFELFNTYLISTAKVRKSRNYSIRANKFEWVVDKFTIVEPVSRKEGKEDALHAPTRLNALSFTYIEHQHPDFLALVANYNAMQYTANQTKRFQEAIVMDNRLKKNQQMLIAYTLKRSSASLSSLNLATIEDEIIPISNIASLSSSVQTFSVEGEISFSDSFQLFTCCEKQDPLSPKSSTFVLPDEASKNQKVPPSTPVKIQ
ncbi:hypothetical protein HAX54_009859 [Datura stramonium]|uniref:Uncharacterized protein n=1 Tax=Datura stramonium TaxID=4076 RepID=A0ABS8TG87_DATST|nr:hypothetical protein [Datura stramonium]